MSVLDLELLICLMINLNFEPVCLHHLKVNSYARAMLSPSLHLDIFSLFFATVTPTYLTSISVHTSLSLSPGLLYCCSFPLNCHLSLSWATPVLSPSPLPPHYNDIYCHL